MRTVPGSTDDSLLVSRTSEDGRRWISVASSTASDPYRAAATAAKSAVCGPDPVLLVAFCTAGLDPAAVAAGFAAVIGATPLDGCSTRAVVTPAGKASHGIAVLALGGSGFAAATAAANAANGRQREAGAEVAGSLARAADRDHRVMLLLTDGRTQCQEHILSGVYSVVGASVPLIGGSASTFRSGRRGFQFHGGQVLSDSVIGVLIGSDAPMGLAVRHGWRRVGQPLVVTHSVDGIVKTLNDRPALAVYLQNHGAPPEVFRNPRAFQAFARTRPIGIPRRIGEDVRDVSSLDHLTEGWLRSNAEVPEGELIWLMEGDPGSVIAAAGEAVGSAVRSLEGAQPLGLLAFDCAARGCVLGDDGVKAEVAQLAAPGLPMAGMYTWGEIARTQGISAYHNLALAVLALG